MARRVLRSLVVATVSLLGAGALQAQEPFAQDIVPTFTFSEDYVEVVKADPDLGSYSEASDALSPLTISAKASTQGINLSALNADTPFDIAIGDFEILGVLGDDPNYTPGATSIRIAITDEDWDTGDEIKVGQAVISWGDGVVTAKIQVSRPGTYAVAANWYAGYAEPVEDIISATFQFADRILDSRNVYISGNSTVRTKTVGMGANAEEFELSTVSISGAIDTERPVVKAIGLKDGAVVAAESVSLVVSATDNLSVVDVLARVNDEEDFTSLDQDTDEMWSLQDIALNYGDNLIRVYAVDEDGVESIVKQLVVKRWTPVTISVSGEGKVTKGFSGTTLREVGSFVLVTATANQGSIFTGWSGSSESKSESLGIIVQPGLSYTANFVPNPFSAAKGSYSGLVSLGNGGVGSVNVQLTGAGTFSGKVTINGRSEILTGSFDTNGNFSGVLARNGAPLSVNLQLELAGGADNISGTISDGVNTFAVSGDRSIYSAQNPAPQAGYYTVSIPGAEAGDNPKGDGFATVDIGKNGVASVAGSLPDGTAFSFSAPVTRAGTLPIFASLYGGKGLIAGNASFANIPGVGDLSANIRWVKAPAATADGYFPLGFETQVSFIGARYKATAGKRVLNLTPSASNAKVAIGEGGIAEISRNVTVAANNRVTVVNRGAEKLNLEIAAPTGLFSGTFVEPGTGKLRRFSGVILQSQNVGTGLFRGATSSGYVSITAP